MNIKKKGDENMAIEVFNRYENKYLLSEKTFAKMERQISGYMELDEYNRRHEVYSIANIYYDTADNHLIRTSLAKPKYKEKLRLRSYGVPEAGSKVYIEIKKKVAGLVNKRRSAMMLDEALAFLGTGEMPLLQEYMNPQVLREIAYMLERYALRPALCLSYDRRAWFGIDRNDLRISFDANIQSRRDDLSLRSGLYGQRLLPEGVWLMEIKSHTSIPIWLSALLSEYEIYPQSFSKYGAEYKLWLSDQSDRVAEHTEPAARKQKLIHVFSKEVKQYA